MKYLVGLIMMTMLWCNTAQATDMTWPNSSVDKGEVVKVKECEKAADSGQLLLSDVMKEVRSRFWFRKGKYLYEQTFGLYDGGENNPRLSCRRWAATDE